MRSYDRIKAALVALQRSELDRHRGRNKGKNPDVILSVYLAISVICSGGERRRDILRKMLPGHVRATLAWPDGSMMRDEPDSYA